MPVDGPWNEWSGRQRKYGSPGRSLRLSREAAVAAFLFAMVNNGLIMLGVNSYWHYLATGIILVLALTLGLLGAGGKIALPRWRSTSAEVPAAKD